MMKIRKFFIVLKNEFKGILQHKATSRVVAITLFALCVGVNIYIRLFPAYFPQFKKEAVKLAESRILSEVDKYVNESYPNYEPQAKEAVVIKELEKRLNNRVEFNRKVREEYVKLRDFYQDDKGQTYLLELDPYQWMRNTENVLKYGYPGDKKSGDAVYDTYMLAPVGLQIGNIRFLFYSSMYLYKGFSFFFRGIPLGTFLFYLPVFYSLIFFSLLYLFLKKNFSHLGAVMGTLFIGFNKIFIERSSAGWFDNDVLNLIWPLLIVWCVGESLRKKDNILRLLFYAVAASFFYGVYVFTWIGAWFIFLVIGGFYIYTIMNNHLVYYKETFKKTFKENLYYLISGGVFLAGSIIFCFFIARINIIQFVYDNMISNLGLGKPVSPSIWPNTYYTVGELKVSSLTGIADDLYGPSVCMISLFSMFWIFLKEKRSEKKDFVNIMFFWFLFMFYAALKGKRFIVYLSLPLGFFFGGFVSDVCQRIINKVMINLKAKLAVIGAFAVLFFVSINFMFIGALNSATSLYPLMNDNWNKALTYVKENTPRDAILNSWWDYGNLFKAIADRRVIFDGQSQNNSIAYWMAKVILTKDELEALRILRMLNNASNTTYDLLNKYITNPFECFVVLKELLGVNREEAGKFLSEKKIPQEAIDKVCNDLYNQPAPAYFIVEASIFNKISSISFLGNWDFVKLYVYRNLAKPKEQVLSDLQSIFKLSPLETEKYYGEVNALAKNSLTEASFSHSLYFYRTPEAGKLEGNHLCFNNGFLYDLDSKQSIFYSQKYQSYQVPKKIVFYNGTSEEDMRVENGTFDKAITLIKTAGTYKSVILDESLIDSLYFRMHVLKGEGLTYFEPFYMDDDSGIYVYRIKWEEDNG